MLIFSGFVLGFFGSLHCIGMCGPIVLALPMGTDSKATILLKRLMYNFGRVISYGLLGLVFGAIGSSFSLFGYQQQLSVAAGLLMLIFALGALFEKKVRLNIFLSWKIGAALRAAIGKYITLNTFPSQIVLGLLNGFLPCGFVYIALTGAVALGDALHGAVFMMLFGFGTIPAMLITSLLPMLPVIRKRVNTARVVPALSILLAVLFILRGLNLGIPYISPKMQNTETHKQAIPHHKPAIDCCD